MNKEINYTFKAKRLDNGEWIEGDLINVYDGTKQIARFEDTLLEPENNYREMLLKFYYVDPDTIQLTTHYCIPTDDLSIDVVQNNLKALISNYKDNIKFNDNSGEVLIDNIKNDFWSKEYFFSSPEDTDFLLDKFTLHKYHNLINKINDFSISINLFHIMIKDSIV